MRKQLKKYGHYYLLLSVMFICGFVLFLSFMNNPQVQMVIVMLTSFCYVGFAVFQHHRNNDLTAKVMVEYVLMAALGIAVVYFYLT